MREFNGGLSFAQRLKVLRIRYQGQTKVNDVRQFYFHDLETNTNFHVRDLDDLDEALDVHRKHFYEENPDAS
jgi:hypothetical protein